jgi:hypothetical protein
MCVVDGGQDRWTWRPGPGHTCTWFQLMPGAGMCATFAGTMPPGPNGRHCDVHFQACNGRGVCLDVRFYHRPVS